VLAWAAFGSSGCRAGPRLCESSARRSSDVCLRFDAPARDRPFGHCVAESAPPVRSSARFPWSTRHKWRRFTRIMIDRTPLLRFLSPAVLAGHVARAGSCHASPAIPLRSFVGLRCLLRPRMPFIRLDPPPTHRQSPLTLAVLRIVRSGCPSTSRGSTPRVLIGTLRRFRGTSLHRSVPRPPRVMRRPLFRAAFRYRAAGHVAWSGLFRRRSVLGFPSRDDLGATLRPASHACDGVAFDAFPDGTRGVSDVHPSQVCSRHADASRVSTDANPHAVCQFIGRSVPAARSAARKIQLGAFGRSPF
jgi:hypothetical protein